MRVLNKADDDYECGAHSTDDEHGDQNVRKDLEKELHLKSVLRQRSTRTLLKI